jgi:hypothetical protein
MHMPLLQAPMQQSGPERHTPAVPNGAQQKPPKQTHLPLGHAAQSVSVVHGVVLVHSVVEVVLDEVDVEVDEDDVELDDVELDDVELDDVEDEELDDEVAVPDVDVVPPGRHAALEFRLEARGHPELQAAPAAQQRRFEPLPHGVVPLGQPHKPFVALTQATPPSQQRGPQGVVPAAQQHDVDGSEHDWPFWQQPLPHTGAPLGHVTAPPLKGRRSVAPTAAAAAAPSTLRAPRRLVGSAIDRDSSSKPSPI